MGRTTIALLCAWLCAACKAPATPTETIVVVQAEPDVRAVTAKLHVQVQSVSDGIVRLDAEVEPEWPVRLAVVPIEADAARKFILSIRALRADGSVPLHARVGAGFVAARKRYHQLLLTGSCLTTPECDEDSSCSGGECSSIWVSTSSLSSADCSLDSCRMELASEAGVPEVAAGSVSGAAGASVEAAGSMGQTTCTDTQLACAEGCVARDSLQHCGACERDCRALPNVAGPTNCRSERCVFEPNACEPGHADCNGDADDGCETDLNTQADCGACRVACSEKTQLCVAAQAGGYTCVSKCPPDRPTACADECIDTLRDARNCGGCGDSFSCGNDRVCQDGRCVAACVPNTECQYTECQRGVTHCEANTPACVATRAVDDGTACGAGASCHAGRCACGVGDGRQRTWDPCASEADCQPGHACIDLQGNGAFFCKPLCDAQSDCDQYKPTYNLECAAVLCGNDRDPKIHVCVEATSYLAPSYTSTACCGSAVNAPPSRSGCADGTREAFADPTKYPSIAGCEANWPAASTRAPTTGRACGNTLGIACRVPADACATGWHVCGRPPYGPVDIYAKLSANECETPPGRFAMALGDTDCEACADEQGKGAACCGTDCTQAFGDCVFPARTAWFGFVSGRLGLCGGLAAVAPGQGVLCCRGF